MKQKDQRRKRVYDRLEKQLASGVKPAKQTKGTIPLTDADKARIEKEMITLKARS